MSELELLGSQCLQLLGNAATVTALEHLRHGPASTREITAAAPGIGYRTLMSRVQLLAEHGLVETGRELRLLTPGHAALSVIDVAASCEAEWPSQGDRFNPAGTEALALAGDGPWQAIARVLAHERARVRDLEGLLPRLTHSTLERRIHAARDLGLIVSERDGRDVWHSLSRSARRLAALGLYAARWEWKFGRRDKGQVASDLAGILHQIAPLAQVSYDMKGVCALREDWHTTIERDVYLAVADGRASPYAVAPPTPPDVSAHGTPQQWIQALVTGDSAGLTCTGDSELLTAVVSALHDEVAV
jgi:DNA-binding HxlR family transcriptional regulator